MSKVLPAMGLRCPDCKTLVCVNFAYIEDNTLWLHGKCAECKETLRFNTEAIITGLMGQTFVDEQKGRPN